jgi:hypothetical protein
MEQIFKYQLFEIFKMQKVNPSFSAESLSVCCEKKGV